MTLSVQFMTMISMVLGGFYLGIIQDTYRRIAIYWKGNTFFKYFMEIGFWLSQTMILYYVLFRVNSGELRFYVFVAAFLGFAIYQVIAATLYKRLLEHIIRIIATIYRFIERTVQVLLIKPVTFIIQLVITTVLFTLQFLLKLVLFIAKLIVSPFLWVLRILFKLLPESIQEKLNKLAGFYSTIENTCKKWMKYILFKRR